LSRELSARGGDGRERPNHLEEWVEGIIWELVEGEVQGPEAVEVQRFLSLKKVHCFGVIEWEGVVTQIKRDESRASSQHIWTKELQNRDLSVIVWQGEVLEERAGGGRGEEALLETVDAAISTSITWQRSMEKERGGVTIEIQRDEIRQMIIFDDVRETDQACLADQTPWASISCESERSEVTFKGEWS
jgi:hypothetical protein